MSNIHMRIVPMTRSHIPACEDIVRTSDPWKTYRVGIDFKSAVKLKQAHVLTIADAVAGFVLFNPDPVFARGGYLRALAVAPAIRGFGVGQTLLGFAEKATAKKSPNLYLCVSSFNREGQRFYRKCGYAKVGKIDDLVRKGFAEHIMMKRLRK